VCAEKDVAAEQKSEAHLRFDLFELDPTGCQLRRSGEVVGLPPQALRILSLLTAHPNELVTRQEIKEQLWPGESHGDFDNRMNFAVKRLREALGDSAEEPRYVQTVRNAGYKFIAPVRSTQSVSEANGYHPLDRPDEGFGPLPAGSTEVLDSTRHQGFRLGLSAGLIAVIVSTAVIAVIILKQSMSNSPKYVQGAQATSSVVYSEPKISSVSPIVAQSRQRIVIHGTGFGLHVAYANTDSSYLALRDKTRNWSAGRLLPFNWDEVMVDVESWTDTEIVISGFSGDYGQKGWMLAEGDQLEVAVWNPQNGVGPALFLTTVGSSDGTK
jgi:DNA-binding winged helix-turn-helix (wHTH) protein